MTTTAASILAAFLPAPVNGDHGPVTTTTACDVEVSRMVSGGVAAYAVSGDVDTEGTIVGPYSTAVGTLARFGCPCPADCMIEADYDLDFLAGLSDR